MMNASFSYNTHDCRLNGSFGWQTALTATDGIARRETDRGRAEWEEGRDCDGDRRTLGREWTKNCRLGKNYGQRRSENERRFHYSHQNVLHYITNAGRVVRTSEARCDNVTIRY